MRLVLDTNVLIAALLKDSTTREILLSPSFEFLLPEYALEEVDAHKEIIAGRTGLKIEEIDVVLSILLENITIIPASAIEPHLKKARKIMGRIDPLDVPFVALALSVENDGIWSNDRHFQKIKGIKVWKTHDVLNFITKR